MPPVRFYFAILFCQYFLLSVLHKYSFTQYPTVVRKASCHTEKYSEPSCISAKEKPDTYNNAVSGSCLILSFYPFTFLLFYLFHFTLLPFYPFTLSHSTSVEEHNLLRVLSSRGELTYIFALRVEVIHRAVSPHEVGGADVYVARYAAHAYAVNGGFLQLLGHVLQHSGVFRSGVEII